MLANFEYIARLQAYPLALRHGLAIDLRGVGAQVRPVALAIVNVHTGMLTRHNTIRII